MIKQLKHKNPKERGQALILIAVTFVVLLAFVGLATDVGLLFIRYGQLRAAVDAAALAAAAQIREGRTDTQIVASAKQVIELNGVSPDTVVVEQCTDDPLAPGADLCRTPPVKLVRVIGSVQSELGFLQLIGASTVPLVSSATAEAASLDVILVIDVSQSMANEGDEEYGTGNPLTDRNFNDPSQCNPTNTCIPFKNVKESAVQFAQNILNLPATKEADRIAIVTFSDGWEMGGTVSHIPGHWTYDKDEAVATINALNVYEGWADVCPPREDWADETKLGLCREYDESTPANFIGFQCPLDAPGNSYDDLSTCTTTNIGGGLLTAAGVYSVDARPNALRVVILLTDGANNASSAAPDDCGLGACTVDDIRDNLPFGYCPSDDPKCRDDDARWSSRHIPGASFPNCPPAVFDTSGQTNPNVDCPNLYDADDFAMDVADFLACDPYAPASLCRQSGQGSIIFTIGLGNSVVGSVDSSGWRAFGAYLLRYIANVGDDGDPDPFIDLCKDNYSNNAELSISCGNYYFIQNVNQLPAVFEAIASRIFTRLAR